MQVSAITYKAYNTNRNCAFKTNGAKPSFTADNKAINVTLAVLITAIIVKALMWLAYKVWP